MSATAAWGLLLSRSIPAVADSSLSNRRATAVDGWIGIGCAIDTAIAHAGFAAAGDRYHWHMHSDSPALPGLPSDRAASTPPPAGRHPESLPLSTAVDTPGAADRWRPSLRRSSRGGGQPRSVAIALLAVVAVSLGVCARTATAQAVERELGGFGGWEVVDQPPETGPEAELFRARQDLADGRFQQARRRADAWLDRYDDHPLRPEALLVRADAQVAAGNHYKALFDYEAIAVDYPGSEAFGIALEREFEIARLFANGMRRKMWGLRIADASREAEELFIRIQERLPGSKLAERAGRELADFYFRRQEMDLATTAYSLYLENHPNAPDRAEAMQRLIFAYLATAKGPNFDPSGLYNAQVWLNRLAIEFPAEAEQLGDDALEVRIREADAERMLVNARWYLKRGDEVSAKFVMDRLLRRYPESVAARRAFATMVDRGWIDLETLEAGGSVEAATDESELESAPTPGLPTDAADSPTDPAPEGAADAPLDDGPGAGINDPLPQESVRDGGGR